MSSLKIIIFGASGDLSRRKLFPALYKLKSEDFEVIGYSRTNLESNFNEYISKLFNYDEEFLKRVKYISGQYNDLQALKPMINENTICYLSVPPSLYILLIKQLIELNVRRICLEKPFGEDLQSFLQIKKLQDDNENLNIYFVDHYLYKPMTVVVPEFYNQYPLLNDIMQRKYIDNVQIYFKEQLGSEGRVYFEKTGLLRDVIQNHVGEIMGTLAAGSDDRTDLLGRANQIEKKESLCGQYDEYRRELLNESKTETFSMMAVTFNDNRWLNVPFTIIAGKGLDEKRVEGKFVLTESGKKKIIELLEIVVPEQVIEYKLMLKDEMLENVSIIFNYSPENEIYLELKFPQTITKITLFDESDVMKIMKLKYNDLTDHEIVFDGLIKNTKVVSAKSREVEYLWRLFNPNSILTDKASILYPKGIDIPNEAHDLLKKIIKTYRKKR